MATRRTTADLRRRTLSQNLLHDSGTARRLVALSGVSPGDLAVEPGPGRGAVTRLLAARTGRVLAYEADPVFARLWDGDPRVRVRHADFRSAPHPREPFHLVGNIPFGATAGIVSWCLDAPALRSATMITQAEYALKRTGGYRRWTRLTVASWPWFAWDFLGRIGREAFRPRPAVDAGFLRIERRPLPLVPRERAEAWRRTVEAGFTGTGGSLAASLTAVHPRRRVRDATRAAGLDPRTPVGLVAPETWLAVFARL